eukprot:TRINITY_DN1534_c0_g1_i1.p1 TRINITY_DN1534_c0_g1~~TRINITY_DN1534_c0_g1_i1.p1  ORF type:complete len:861 (+),score=115.11 TRINITY_DN1534_c0_g1_i1:51-2633(+)
MNEENYRFSVCLSQIAGKDLAVCDASGTSDPFIEISLPNGMSLRTTTLYKNLNPTFSEVFQFELSLTLQQILNDHLLISVYDEDALHNCLIGLVNVPYSYLIAGPIWHNLPLMSPENLNVNGRLIFNATFTQITTSYLIVSDAFYHHPWELNSGERGSYKFKINVKVPNSFDVCNIDEDKLPKRIRLRYFQLGKLFTSSAILEISFDDEVLLEHSISFENLLRAIQNQETVRRSFSLSDLGLEEPDETRDAAEKLSITLRIGFSDLPVFINSQSGVHDVNGIVGMLDPVPFNWMMSFGDLERMKLEDQRLPQILAPVKLYMPTFVACKPESGGVVEEPTTEDTEFWKDLITEDIDIEAIEKPIDPNKKDRLGNSALHLACEKGSVVALERLIHFGVLLELPNDSGKLPLVLAIENDHLEILKILLDQNVSTKLDREDGFSILHLAVMHGSFELIEFLLDRGMNANDTTPNGIVPFHVLADRADLTSDECARIANALVDRMGQFDVSDNRGNSPLAYACMKNNHSYVDWLVNHGGSVDFINHESQSPLYLAFKHDSFDCIELLRNKANSALVNIYGRNQLHISCLNNEPKVCRFLLDTFSDEQIAHVDNFGKSAFYYAVEVDAYDCMCLFVDHDVPWSNIIDRKRETVLHKFSSHNDLQRIQKIIKETPILGNYRNSRGKLAIWNACYSNNLEIARYFIDEGMHLVDVPNIYDAILDQHPETIKLLYKLGKPLPTGLIHFIVKRNDVAALKEVLDLVSSEYFKEEDLPNVNLDEIDSLGYPPLYYSIQSSNVEITELLLEAGANPHFFVGQLNSLEFAQSLIEPESTVHLDDMNKNLKPKLFEATSVIENVDVKRSDCQYQ